jgi:hypothetical protein
MTPDMAVVTPLNNFLGPEGDTVTVDEQLLNTEYWHGTVTDASQSTTFRLCSSAAAPVTGAAAPCFQTQSTSFFGFFFGVNSVNGSVRKKTWLPQKSRVFPLRIIGVSTRIGNGAI